MLKLWLSALFFCLSFGLWLLSIIERDLVSCIILFFMLLFSISLFIENLEEQD